jgi:hypothetical protein
MIASPNFDENSSIEKANNACLEEVPGAQAVLEL